MLYRTLLLCCDTSLANTLPSNRLGRAISTSLPKTSAKGFKVCLKKADVPAHYSKVGDSLSLHPKIYGLYAYAKIRCGFAYGDGKFFMNENARRAFVIGFRVEEVICVHALF